MSCGDHYNPDKKNHGGVYDEERHLGDIGNLKTNEAGFAYAAFTDDFLSLFGEKTIIGRSVVITEKEDDFGRHDS